MLRLRQVARSISVPIPQPQTDVRKGLLDGERSDSLESAFSALVCSSGNSSENISFLHPG